MCYAAAERERETEPLQGLTKIRNGLMGKYDQNNSINNTSDVEVISVLSAQQCLVMMFMNEQDEAM